MADEPKQPDDNSGQAAWGLSGFWKIASTVSLQALFGVILLYLIVEFRNQNREDRVFYHSHLENLRWDISQLEKAIARLEVRVAEDCKDCEAQTRALWNLANDLRRSQGKPPLKEGEKP